MESNTCKIVFAVLVSLFLCANNASAAVRFSEIAWMGTSESSDAEWIELYNSATEPVVLDGYRVYEEYGLSTQRLLVTLCGTVPGNGYFVFARATTTFSADFIKKFESNRNLSNSGEIIAILDNSSTTLDMIDASSKWPAGDSDRSKNKTMQWTGSSWITESATPRAANALVPATSTTTSDTKISSSSGTATVYSGVSSHESNVPLSAVKEEQEFGISVGRNRLAFVGAPIQFVATGELGTNNVTPDTVFVWNFGDGTVATNTAPSHVYLFEGEYQVVVNAIHGNDVSVDRLVVEVEDPKVEIVGVATGTAGWVEIANKLGREINVGHSVLRAGDRKFEMPKDTIVSKNAKIKFANLITGILPIDSVEILWVDGRTLSFYKIIEESVKNATATILNAVASSSDAILGVQDDPTDIAIVEPPSSAKDTGTAIEIKKIPQNKSTSTVTIIPRKQSTMAKIFGWPNEALARLQEMFSNR